MLLAMKTVSGNHCFLGGVPARYFLKRKALQQLRFTLRYDPAIQELDSKTTRLRFENKVYNIKAIDSLTYPQKIILIDATEEVQYANN